MRAGSAAGDKAALLAVAADPANAGAVYQDDRHSFDGITQLRGDSIFYGWDAGAEPCAAGSWDDSRRGYHYVECDRQGGRVVQVWKGGSGLGCDVALFAPLGNVQVLNLHSNAALHGDVASLGGLVEMRYLDLSDTAVHGAPGSLSGLSHLGESPSVPGVLFSRGVLHLADTRVAGPVAALRALPSLGSDWGSGSDDFSGCDGFPAATCRDAGMAVVAKPSGVAGTDECGCCADSPLVRDEATGCYGECETGASGHRHDRPPSRSATVTIVIIMIVAVFLLSACVFKRRHAKAQPPQRESEGMGTAMLADHVSSNPLSVDAVDVSVIIDDPDASSRRDWLTVLGSAGQDKALQTVLDAWHGGRWVLVRELGRGSGGVVFESSDSRLGPVAIKFAYTEARNLEREAALMQRVAHDRVVKLYECHVAGEGRLSGMVMELLEKGSLADRIKDSLDNRIRR